MKKSYILFLIILTISVSCNKDKDNNVDNTQNNANSFIASEFKATIDNKTWEAQYAFYEIEGENIVITAVSKNYEKLFVTIENTKSGTYKLNNRTFFVNTEGTSYASKGSITLDIDDSEILSGSFSIDIINSQDSSAISVSNGTFEMLKSGKQLKDDNKTLNTSKIMIIDTDKGAIEDKKINYEITFKQRVIVFKATDEGEKSFSIEISKSEINNTASIFYSANPKIEYIFVDGLKKQLTIFYKNGNNKTYYN